MRSISVSEIGGYSDMALLGEKLYVIYEKTIPTGISKYSWYPFELFLDVFELSE